MQDDSTLISRLQQRDEQALSALYDKYSGAIYGVILKMTKDEIRAKDLLQETFITVWEKSYQYDPKKGRFYTWVYRIAKNKVLNFLRKPVKLIQTDDFSVYKQKEAPITFEAEHLELKGALTTLKEHHKTAIEMVYFKGLTHREAHEEMGVPLGTFKSYVRQALKELRASYAKMMLVIVFLIIFGI